MLSKANEGRWFTREYQRKREQAVVDRTRFSDAELGWLEVEDDQGLGRDDPRSYEGLTQPIDPLTRPRRINLRNREDR